MYRSLALHAFGEGGYSWAGVERVGGTWGRGRSALRSFQCLSSASKMQGSCLGIAARTGAREALDWAVSLQVFDVTA